MEYISEDININEIKIIIADDEIRTCEEIKEYLSLYNQIKILGIANSDEEEILLLLNSDVKPLIIKSLTDESLIQLILPIKTY